MIITEEEFNKRIESESNPISTLKIVEVKKPARGPELTENERAEIGTLAHIIGNKNTADLFQMNPDRVCDLKLGNVNDHIYGSEDHPELRKKINDNLSKVKDVALEKLMKSLDLITPEKLEKQNPIQLSTIADKMAGVIFKTTPKEVTSNQANIIIYAPNQKSIKDFDVVEV